jgi:hypothetical protein
MTDVKALLRSTSYAMQNYVVAKPVHGGADLVAFPGIAGEVELVSVGNDGQVYYGARQTDATGWIARSLGPSDVSANAPVVALTADGLGDGRVVIVAAKADGTLFWSHGTEVQQALLPLVLPSPGLPPMPWAALQVKLYGDGNATLMILAGSGGGESGMWLFQAASQTWTFQRQVYGSGWTGDVASCRQGSGEVDFYMLENTFNGNMLLNYRTCDYYKQQPAYSAVTLGVNTTDNHSVYFERIAVAAFEQVKNRAPLPFGATATGDLYTLDVGSSILNTVWKRIAATGGPVKQIVASVSAQELIHLYVLMADGSVMALHEVTSGGAWTQPIPLTQGVTRIAGALRRDGAPIGFAVTTSGELYQWFQQADTTDWLTQPVALENQDENVAEVWSYSTQLLPVDVQGMRRPGARVRLWASGTTPIVVNGNGALLSPTVPVEITTDGFGLVNLVYVASDLGSPVLRVWHDDMPEGEAVEMQMNYEMQSRLEALTGDQLLDLNQHDGSPLLTGEAHNKETADSVAQAVNLCMSLARPPLSNDGNADVQDPPSPGIPPSARASTTEPLFLHRIDPSRVTEQHWVLQADCGKVTFQRLTHQQAMGRMEATAKSSLKLPSWGDVKSFLRSTGTKVTEVFVSTILDVTGKLVQSISAQITIIVNGISKVYKSTVAFVEQAFDLVESIFWTVGTKVSDLLAAFSYLFDWDDILRTQEGVSWMFRQVLLFLKSLTQDAAAASLLQLDALRGLVKSKLKAAEQSELAGKTLRELLGLLPEGSAELSKEVTDGVAHNIILTAFADHANGSTITIPPTNTCGLSDAQIKALENANTSTSLLIENLRGSGVGEQMLERLGPCLDDPSKVLDLTIGDLLKVLAQALEFALDLVEGLVEAFFATVGEFIQNCHDFLLAPWDIPLITPLYKRITKQAGVESNLTVLGVFSLMLAVPATPTMKLITGHAPFPDDAALAEFKAAYTVDSLRRSAGLSSLSRTDAGEEAIYTSYAAVFLTVRTAAIGVGAFFSVASDIKAFGLQNVAPTQEELGHLLQGVKPGPNDFDALTAIGCAVLSTFVWLSECPWGIYADAGNCDISTGKGKANVMWVGRSFIQGSRIILAIATTRTDTQIYQIGPWLASGLGVCNFALRFAECYVLDVSVPEGISRCLPAVPEILRFGLDDGIAIQTKGISVAFVIASEIPLSALGCVFSGKQVYEISKS